MDIYHLVARQECLIMLQWGMHCFYFAYGSNLNLPHLQDVLASHGADTGDLGLPRCAILQGYRLRTNYLSSTRGAGACNIEPDEGSIVEGAVMEISPAIREVLRIKEGWPHRYEEIMVDVLVGDRRESIRALTYVVTPDHALDLDMPVTPRYRRLVLDGARAAALSKSYQEQLARLLRTTESSFSGIAREIRDGSSSRHMAPSALESAG